MPGTGKRTGGCLGGAGTHPAEAGGSATGAGNTMPVATGVGTNIGWILFGRGSCWRPVGPGSTPVGGTGPKCFAATGRI